MTTDVSERIQKTDRAAIEDIIDKYSDIPDLASLAMGSVRWGPPEESVTQLQSSLADSDNHLYSSIMGYEDLRESIRKQLQKRGLR